MATTLTRWDPFQQIAQVQREMDRILGRTMPGGQHDLVSWVPPADVEQTEDAVVFKLDTPGVRKDDLSIEVHGRTLTISGQRREQHDEMHEGYLVRERAYGGFSRSFMLPENVDEDDITATFENGQLRVSVPRPELESPRKVEISDSP
jgi:HSP20 family protein